MTKTLNSKIVLSTMFLFFVLYGGKQLSAQTDHNPPQIICIGSTKPYQVDYLENSGEGTTGSTYNWSVISGPFAGTINTNQGPNGSSNRIVIDWGASPVGNYTLQVIETNGGCPGTPMTLAIEIEDLIEPTFTQIGPLCQGSPAPTLPETSNNVNGITGTWNPAIINTTNPGISTYTFTPDDGQCASITTMDIEILEQIIPTFATIGPLCQNSPAPDLITTSTNNIDGTWNGSISTATTGSFDFIFTPSNPAQCGTSTTITVVIEPPTEPEFANVGPFCTDDAIDPLNTTSINGIEGTWSPAINNTATTTYTFLPNSGECATTTTLTITINDQVTPTFNPIGPFCQNSIPTDLPLVSTNLIPITGTWDPPVIDTENIGIAQYTFNPDAGQCATSVTRNVVIDTEISPSFALDTTYCLNEPTTALPETSSNGIDGTWNATSVATDAVGTTEYTFTPADGQCAIPYSVNITVNPLPTISVNSETICSGESTTLNASGANTYVWSPDTGLSATTGTTVNANPTNTTEYTITGTDANGCSNSTTATVTVTPAPVTSPIFHD